MKIIETQDLRKQFKVRKGKGQTQTVEAVKGVSLAVDEGEIFGFLGPNGAGKSTTLRMLSTLLPPTSGQAQVVGIDLLHQPDRVREQIGYVSQSGGADGSATARENLTLQAKLFGLNTALAKQRCDALIHALQLESFVDRQVKTYSGGQRRRLDIALGMVNQPRLLFLDEPTTGLDPQSRAHMWDEVRALRKNGTTIFLTTHYLDEADALADRLAIIDDGHIVSEGTPTSLKRQISGDIVTLGIHALNGEKEQAAGLLKSQTYVRELRDAGDGFQLTVEHGEESLPALLRLLDTAGLHVTRVALSRPSLDDVFLQQTGRSLRDAEA
ncbi:MAG: ATP-binding cassette domain-containing protein [Anaerolineae bacterium]